MNTTTGGVLWIHSAPSALCPHIEWAVGGVFRAPARLDWTPQPAERAAYRAEYEWSGPVGGAARLASQLQSWGRLRFEVTEHASAGSEGVRFCYTPTLGIFQSPIGASGDVLVHEERIKNALGQAALGQLDIVDALHDLLGTSWDEELEVFRRATTPDAPVRWLHKVV